MRLDKTLTAVMLLGVASISFAYIPPEAFPITYTASTTGTQRVCVIAATVKEDWDPGATEFPMPDWLTDNFIMPWEGSLDDLDDPQWQYSLTNYYNTISSGDYNVVGKANENNNGEYFVADNYYASDYTTVRGFEEEILAKADAVIDFADYDGDGDGVVDLCYMVLPRVPMGWPDSRGISGRAFGFYPDYETQDDAVGGGKVKIAWGNTFEVGSTEQENFVLGQLTLISSHEHGHLIGLDDWYDNGGFTGHAEDFHNLYAASSPLGMYSRMQTGQPVTQPMPYSSAELVTELDWGNVDTVWENDQNQVIGDYLETGDIVVVPVSTAEHEPAIEGQPFDEYFVLSAHLKSHPTRSYWEDEVEGTGLLIWHVYKTWGAGWYPGTNFSELKKRYDLECAGGKWNLDGFVGPDPYCSPKNPNDPRPELGWGRLELNCGWTPAQGWSNSYGGTWSNEDDYFHGNWKTAMHSLTNPSTDAYNFNAWETVVYPSGEWGVNQWQEKDDEGGYRQNLATHISFEGIHQIDDHHIKLCIRRSRIWTDEEYAMDRTTQRKFLCDTTDTSHFIYPSKGYVYYTQSYDPSEVWYTADLLGYGKWPAIALDENDRAAAVWFDDSVVVYNYHADSSDWYYALDSAAILDLTGTPGPVAIDFARSYNGKGGYEIPDGLPGHSGGGGGGSMPALPDSSLSPMVHLAYITRDGSQDKLYYTYFHKHLADQADDNEECVDSLLVEGTSHDITGAAIELDPANGKICIAYGVVKNDTAACYYREKTIYGWQTIRRLPTSISSSAREPLVPFLDIIGDSIRVVFNANDSVYVNVKPLNIETPSGGWNAVSTRVSQASGENRYAQIGGNMITWTNIAGADTNVYGCHLASDYTPGTPFRVSSPYSEKDWFCQVTKADTSAACLYQHGTFDGPKWAVYYRGPDGFGGNMESDGPAAAPIATGPVFKMALSRNILRGTQLSVFTTDECELAVYDVTGRRVARFEVETKGKDKTIETPIDCQNWSSGVYFVRAVHQGDTKTDIRTEKVVLFR